MYPEFISEHWIDPGLLSKVQSAVDGQGYARISMMEESNG